MPLYYRFAYVEPKAETATRMAFYFPEPVEDMRQVVRRDSGAAVTQTKFNLLITLLNMKGNRSSMRCELHGIAK